MAILVHIITFVAATAIVWFFAGVLIDSVGRIARRYCRTGFFTAFFILGALTSISEFSVAINSTLAGVPGVSVGNIVGASVVLLLLIVPFLAVAGGGLPLARGLSGKGLAIMLGTIALPALLVIDGNVTRTEGLLAILAYGTVAYSLYRQRESIAACDVLDEPFTERVRSLAGDLGRIVLGSVAIFAAAHFLVEQAVYFAGVFHAPASLVALLLLSIGTNIPEIVIAVRSLLRRKVEVALGDYLGSAAMNTFIFGLLGVGAGTFLLESSEFLISAVLVAFGFCALYAFARSGRTITRTEGAALLLFYAAFLVSQVYLIATFAS